MKNEGGEGKCQGGGERAGDGAGAEEGEVKRGTCTWMFVP